MSWWPDDGESTTTFAAQDAFDDLQRKNQLTAVQLGMFPGREKPSRIVVPTRWESTASSLKSRIVRRRNRLYVAKVAPHGWRFEHPVGDIDLTLRTPEASGKRRWCEQVVPNGPFVQISHWTTLYIQFVFKKYSYLRLFNVPMKRHSFVVDETHSMWGQIDALLLICRHPVL